MGRSSILLVMGFNIIFLLMGFNLSRVSTTAYENYISYYQRSVAHNLSGSANVHSVMVYGREAA